MLSSIYGEIHAKAMASSRHRISVLTRKGSIMPRPETYQNSIQSTRGILNTDISTTLLNQ